MPESGHHRGQRGADEVEDSGQLRADDRHGGDDDDGDQCGNQAVFDRGDAFLVTGESVDEASNVHG